VLLGRFLAVKDTPRIRLISTIEPGGLCGRQYPATTSQKVWRCWPGNQKTLYRSLPSHERGRYWCQPNRRITSRRFFEAVCDSCSKEWLGRTVP